MPEDSKESSKLPQITFVEKDHNLRALLEFTISHSNYKQKEFKDQESLWNVANMPNTMLVMYNLDDDSDEDKEEKG